MYTFWFCIKIFSAANTGVVTIFQFANTENANNEQNITISKNNVHNMMAIPGS